MLIACMNALKDAISYAQAAESHWPPSMYMPDGQFVMTYDSREKAPDNEMLGPVSHRGGHSGIVYRGAELLAGEPAHWAEVHQATGMVSVQLGVSVDEAFVRLRARAFADGRSLKAVAGDVISRRLVLQTE